MRHRIYGKKLGRNRNERKALFRNLVHSLILHRQIETTQAKAKAIKGLIDRIIIQAKSPNTKRLVSQFLASKNIEEKLNNEILPKIGSRQSGFTTITKLGKRLGDNSLMVQMRMLLEEGKEEVKGKKSKGKSTSQK